MKETDPVVSLSWWTEELVVNEAFLKPLLLVVSDTLGLVIPVDVFTKFILFDMRSECALFLLQYFAELFLFLEFC